MPREGPAEGGLSPQVGRMAHARRLRARVIGCDHQKLNHSVCKPRPGGIARRAFFMGKFHRSAAK